MVTRDLPDLLDLPDLPDLPDFYQTFTRFTAAHPCPLPDQVETSARPNVWLGRGLTLSG